MWGLISELKCRGKYENPKLKVNKNENAKVMVETLVEKIFYSLSNGLSHFKWHKTANKLMKWIKRKISAELDKIGTKHQNE